MSKIDTPSGTQEMTIINESGVYSLIFSSKLPSAKQFKRWVTSEVLPTLRKTGAYVMPGAEAAETPGPIPPAATLRSLTTDDYISAARIVADCRNERLPYVLGFLEKGGFEIPRVEEAGCLKPVVSMEAQTGINQEDVGIFINLVDFF